MGGGKNVGREKKKFFLKDLHFSPAEEGIKVIISSDDSRNFSIYFNLLTC